MLEWTTEYFQKHSIENARLDVEVLLSHVLQCERIDLYANYSAPVDESHRTDFRQLVLKRVDGCPVAYLVGYREFFTLRFEVNPSVLIPRPETEHVVVEALEFAKTDAVERFLEIGVGSGAISVTVVHENPSLRALAVDVSDAAIEVARRNAEANGVLDRIEFLTSDVYASIPPGQFDMILSNPPYVSTEEMPLLDRDARDFEPRLALDGGKEGIEILRRVIQGASDRLRPGGKLILEIGASQEGKIRSLIEAEPGLSFCRIVKDLAGRPRVVSAVRTGV